MAGPLTFFRWSAGNGSWPTMESSKRTEAEQKKKTTEKGHLLGIETVDFDSGDYSNIAAAFFVDSIVEATPATVDDGFERLALWCVPSGAAIESKKRKKKEPSVTRV